MSTIAFSICGFAIICQLLCLLLPGLWIFNLIMLFAALVPIGIVDPSKDLNSYGLGNVNWKERVEGWKLKQEKI